MAEQAIIYPLISFLFLSLISLMVYTWKGNKKSGEQRDKILKTVNDTLTELKIMTAENKIRIDTNEKEIGILRNDN